MNNQRASAISFPPIHEISLRSLRLPPAAENKITPPNHSPILKWPAGVRTHATSRPSKHRTAPWHFHKHVVGGGTGGGVIETGRKMGRGPRLTGRGGRRRRGAPWSWRGGTPRRRRPPPPPWPSPPPPSPLARRPPLRCCPLPHVTPADSPPHQL